MKILNRYLLAQHAAPFVFAFCAMTGFMLLQQIARRLETLLGKGLPWSVLVEFFALTIPFLVAMTLSMSVLIAVLYTFSRLAGDNELTAMRAGGVSFWELVRPVLAAAAGVALVAFLFGDQVLPRTNHRLRTLMTDIYRTKPTFSLREHVINDIQRGRIALRAARIDQATYRMWDVTLYDLADPSRQRIVYADRGRIAFAPNQEDLQLTLYDGTSHVFDRDDPRVFQQADFREQLVIVRGVGSEFVRRDSDDYRGDRELAICELEEVVRTAQREEWVTQRRAEAARLNGLRALVGLPALEPDTADAPPDRASPYCRLLDASERLVRAAAGLFRPAPLEAQEPAFIDSVIRAVQRELGEPTRAATVRAVNPRQTLATVRMLRDRARSSRVRAAVYQVEVHKKYAIPAACLVFVLVAVPLAVRFPRGGVGLALGAGFVVFGIFYIGLIGGESLANRLVVPPFWAMWTPNLLLGAFGIVALWQLQRSGAAGRGGGIPAGRGDGDGGGGGAADQERRAA